MRIKKWWLKNYKSYGEVKQVLQFDNDGKLILLVGENGQGKSSILSSLDLCIYGEELNKQGKRLPLKNIPNRINGNMEIGVEIDTDQELKIIRTMDNVNSSLKTKLLIDGIPYDKANKIQEKINEKIGYDFKTYKSFISMNVNNFKNFISLTPEEKRILLDKLFNLEQINELNKILKQLQKNTELEFKTISSEIAIYETSIKDLEDTINNVIIKNENENENKITLLKESIATKKEEYLLIEQQRTDLIEEIDLFKEGIQKLKTKLRDLSRDESDINIKIKLYQSGKCPTCLTALVGELNLLPEFEERLEKTLEIKAKLNTKIKNADIELTKLSDNFDIIDANWIKLTNLIYSIKNEIKSLKTDKTDNLEDFKVNLEDFKTKKQNKETKYLETQKLKFVYDLLLPMWSETGIKRDIIDSIIDPLNEFIKEDLVFLKTRFKVELDNNFDAHIYEWNNEIDPETLSTGEAKKINLIIMLAYIKMLRMKQNINILFLDEVFASMDLTSIDDILVLFKKFANERGINIILVHHAELKDWFFDKIIYVSKNTFSYLEEKLID